MLARRPGMHHARASWWLAHPLTANDRRGLRRLYGHQRWVRGRAAVSTATPPD